MALRHMEHSELVAECSVNIAFIIATVIHLHNVKSPVQLNTLLNA